MPPQQTSQKSSTVADPDPDGTEPGCPIIDAHIHVMPTKLLNAIRDWFTEKTEWTLPNLSAETVVERARRRTDGFVFFPYAHRPGISASLNEFAAEWQSQIDTAIGLGTVHPADDDPKMIVTNLLQKGLHGVKLHCPVQGFSADDPRLDPVYESLTDRDAPLVIHASSHPFYRDEPNTGSGPLKRVLERYPTLRICVPHLGLFETEAFFDLADHYNIYFDTSVALGKETHELIVLRESDLPMDRINGYGDRIMFGTDYPIRPQTYDAAFCSIRDVFPDQYPDVYYGNASEFFDVEFDVSKTQ